MSVLGIAVSLYLYLLHRGIIGEVYCPIGGCDAVMASKWSAIYGVPVALLGLIYYIWFIALVVLKNFNENLMINLALLATVLGGILFTIYLRFVEIFYVHEFCMWCWVSVICIVVIVLVYLVNRHYYFPKK